MYTVESRDLVRLRYWASFPLLHLLNSSVPTWFVHFVDYFNQRFCFSFFLLFLFSKRLINILGTSYFNPVKRLLAQTKFQDAEWI